MDDRKLISIVVPVFNEAGVLEILHGRLNDIIGKLAYDFEIIFVNDGSSDGSPAVLNSLHQKDSRVKVVNLSRNFGQQNALAAGIDQAGGEAVILMDADLEDNPEYITSFVGYWNQGYDVVYAKRSGRNGPALRKVCFAFFHKLNRLISDIRIDAAGVYCLMDREVAKYMRQFSEKDKYIPGLRSWVGFRQIGIEIVRDPRYDYKPRMSFGSLVKLAFDSFTSFSTVPLKISMFLGIAFSLLSFAGIALVLLLKFFLKVTLLGWASIICAILLLGGVQLICMGLQGEYITRIFNEVKNRPNYIIKDKTGFNG